MWMKKNVRDRLTGLMSPVPTQIVSNEEFVPMRQTHDQQRVEYRIDQLASAYAKKLGMSRRAFLRTSGGMATAFIAMNEVFGTAFTVSVAEAMEPEAYVEAWPKDQFIFDAQTHHVKDSIPGPQM
ncbi:MAG: amidohydrolase, partial [Gammaproteobacteria bacterium]